MRKERIVEILIYILMLLLVFSLPSMLKLILDTEVPLAVVKSTSMMPTLNVGDIVVIVGVKPSQLQVGDIIIYNKRLPLSPRSSIHEVEDIGYIIIHRIVKISRDPQTGGLLFRTKGDNNLSADPWYVPEEGIIGKVLTLSINGKRCIFKIPYIGYLSLYIHS